jgi:hypothetical protein
MRRLLGVKSVGSGLIRRPSGLPSIVLQNLFCTGDQKFCGLQALKLTGDFGNAIEVMRISDRFPFRLFAKIRGPATFDFCNTIPSIADMVLHCREPPLGAMSGSRITIVRREDAG